jgi:hypothetical protein
VQCDKDPCAGNQDCIDTESSFTCACMAGYAASATPWDNCIDINECENDPCAANQDCTNTEGSFSCACMTGYLKDFNGDCEGNCISLKMFESFIRHGV